MPYLGLAPECFVESILLGPPADAACNCNILRQSMRLHVIVKKLFRIGGFKNAAGVYPGGCNCAVKDICSFWSARPLLSRRVDTCLFCVAVLREATIAVFHFSVVVSYSTLHVSVFGRH